MGYGNIAAMREKRKILSRTRVGLTIVACGVTVSLAAVGGIGSSSSQDALVQTEVNGAAPMPVGSIPPGMDLPSVATLPIPMSPTGSFGSRSNPLGAPGESVSRCRGRGVASLAIQLAVSEAGFSEYCFVVPAKTQIPVQLAGTVVNRETGLVVPLNVVIATASNPVVAQAQTPDSGDSPPGLTMLSGTNVPNLRLKNAIYTSPTAADSNPIQFVLPALDAGEYLLQTPTVPTVPSALLIVVAAADQVVRPPPFTIVPTTLGAPRALEVNPTDSGRAGLEEAFATWERLPSTCPADVVPGSMRFARTTDGTMWAIARFMPSPSCSHSLAPEVPGGPHRVVPPGMVGPFGRTSGPPLGVFQQKQGGDWVMNQEGGDPFPCPAQGGLEPGPGNGALPAAVLGAWEMTYASDCAFPQYPQRPR